MMVSRTLLLVATLAPGDLAAEPNPPTWPTSVKIYGPGDEAQAKADIAAAYEVNGGQPDHGQFSKRRFAFLFKPGSYDLEVPVGYYTHVAGLGEAPSDVKFTSPKGVYCMEGTYEVGTGALNTFWRMAENFESSADFEWSEGSSGMLWAASQAAPLRRVRQKGDLILSHYRDGEDARDFASGGFLANSEITGTAISGSQQQYYVRNSKLAWDGGVWNMVFLGTEGAPESHCGRDDTLQGVAETLPIVNAGATPSMAEKPFVSIADDGSFKLNVPQLQADTMGPDWSPGTQIDFSEVYVAAADRDTAESLNTKLQEGLHLVLSPGIYKLTEPLRLRHKNQVLLGLGLATLVAENGDAAIEVGSVDGARVAGVLLDAGAEDHQTKTLLRWGPAGSKKYSGSAANPGFLHDVFFRGGGPVLSGVAAEVMLEINADHVHGDDLWLWRADHGPGGKGVVDGQNPSQVGIRVNGDSVLMSGLAVEHVLQDQVQWNGEKGETYFFQAEFPYDVTKDYGEKYVAYRVADTVTSHKAAGVGVYHFFRDHPVTVSTGIACPASLEASFQYPLSAYLNGNGTMKHIINDKGDASHKSDTREGAVPIWYCQAESQALVV
jgi:hypothetical protein